MWRRIQVLLLFLAPLALMAGLYAFGLTLPVPQLGRSYVIRVELPKAGQPVDLPTVLGPPDRSRPLVVIDAGHGGHDPGASYDGIQEKNLALGLALALRDRLLAQGGIRVALTRSDDTFLALEEREDIARRLGADLFLSIHADSAGEESGITGASVYTLSEKASDTGSAQLAERENSADEVNGVSLAGRSDAVNAILLSLSQRHTQEQSSEFARLIVREGAGALQFHPDPLRSANFVVLRAPDVPSALFEAGFVTNPQDAQRLASPAGRESFADVMERAIRIYFARASGMAGQITG
ncbi:MAG TPA: N-acetylmuramoyl-L-alanine amidase [Sphingomonadaceae bacterium]